MSFNASGALESRANAIPIPKYGRGVSRRRTFAPRQTLADAPDFFDRGHYGHHFNDDDLELCTWPEMMDQRRNASTASSRLWHDDAEEDDGDTSIEDAPHDAREEDGI
jgi:hypothetical protein